MHVSQDSDEFGTYHCLLAWHLCPQEQPRKAIARGSGPRPKRAAKSAAEADAAPAAASAASADAEAAPKPASGSSRSQLRDGCCVYTAPRLWSATTLASYNDFSQGCNYSPALHTPVQLMLCLVALSSADIGLCLMQLTSTLLRPRPHRRRRSLHPKLLLPLSQTPRRRHRRGSCHHYCRPALLRPRPR